MSFNSRLSEIAEVIMGQSPKGDEVNDSGIGDPLLNGPAEFTDRYPQPVQFTENGRKFAEKGDVLFCVRGSTTGRMNYADQKYAIGRGICAIRGKNGFPTPYVRAVLEQNLERLLQAATGSTFPNVGRTTINNFEISSVDQSAATGINNFITTLENKIYLNSKINETLEEMSQALFKSWFVDFEPVKAKIAALENGGTVEDPERAAMQAVSGKSEAQLETLRIRKPDQYDELVCTASLFPSAMVESGLGDIPAGWEVVKLEKLAKTITKGTTPSKQALSRSEDSPSIPFLKVKDIADNGEIDKDSLNLVPPSVHRNSLRRSILKKGDLLFSIAGTIGRVAFIDESLEDSNANQAVGIIRLDHQDTTLGLVWMTLRSKRVQENIYSKIVQGVPANTSLKNLRDIEIICPPEPLLEKLNEKFCLFLRYKVSNSTQSRILGKLLDASLPKLLSGELAVSETDEQSLVAAGV